MQGRKVLLVDDEPDVLDTLHSILTDEGYEVAIGTRWSRCLGHGGYIPRRNCTIGLHDAGNVWCGTVTQNQAALAPYRAYSDYRQG